MGWVTGLCRGTRQKEVEYGRNARRRSGKRERFGNNLLGIRKGCLEGFEDFHLKQKGTRRRLSSLQK
ncbi:hypothetical protein RUM43_007168, partial [Polyplax serrata]